LQLLGEIFVNALERKQIRLELERHLHSDKYHKVLLVLEMALKQPEIRFDIISSSTGIETIEKARSHAR